MLLEGEAEGEDRFSGMLSVIPGLGLHCDGPLLECLFGGRVHP